MKAKKSKSENVQVAVRVRPLSKKEKDAGQRDSVHLQLSESSISVANNAGGGEEKNWTFDAVFNHSFSQKDVYLQTAHPVVESVLQGYNGTVFAYGQSGTGKTHTMVGNLDVPDQLGIIPNAMSHIFNAVHALESETMEYTIQASFLELYNGKCRDLLAEGKLNLELKENPQKLFYVKDLSMWTIKSVNDAMMLMDDGLTRREVKSTELNSDSSRSHSLFTVYVRCNDREQDIRTESKLNLVDLAGSERQSKSQATGSTLQEGANINLSLSALGTVIDCLVKGKPHIPYRSSPLTMLLKDALGGTSKTLIVGTVGPSEVNVSETISTLRFVDRAKQIKNKPRVQMDPKDQRIAELTEEVKSLRARLGMDGEASGAYEDETEALRRRVEELEVALETSAQGRDAVQTDLSEELQTEKSRRMEAEEREKALDKQLRDMKDKSVLEAACEGESSEELRDLITVCTEFIVSLDKEKAWKPDRSPASVDDIVRGLRMMRNGSDHVLHVSSMRKFSASSLPGHHASPAPHEQTNGKKSKRGSSTTSKAGTDGNALPTGTIMASLETVQANTPEVREAVEALLQQQRKLLRDAAVSSAQDLGAGAGQGQASAELMLAYEEQAGELERARAHAAKYKQSLAKTKTIAERRMDEITTLKEHVDALRDELSMKHVKHAQELEEQQDRIVQQYNKKTEELVNKHTKLLHKEKRVRAAIQEKMQAMETRVEDAEQRYDVKLMEYENLLHDFEQAKIDHMRKMRDSGAHYGGTQGVSSSDRISVSASATAGVKLAEPPAGHRFPKTAPFNSAESPLGPSSVGGELPVMPKLPAGSPSSTTGGQKNPFSRHFLDVPFSPTTM